MGSCSDAGQDLFAIECSNHKRQGVFVDIGCAFAKDKSNTYMLEKEYKWSGILIDIDPSYQNELFSFRSSPFICADATNLDYEELFKLHELPHTIDYLSLDIDPPDNTLKVLKRLPFDKYIFKVITFEHDRYWFGDSVMEESRELMAKLGYTLTKKDVECSLGPFEDWYTYGS